MSQGFYVNKITYHCLAYSYVMMYLSEVENEPYDLQHSLHFKSTLSWTGTIPNIKLRLKANNYELNKTLQEVLSDLHKRISDKLLYLDMIDETELKEYMLKEIANYIDKFVTSLWEISDILGHR